jgi:hypothetical protein
MCSAGVDMLTASWVWLCMQEEALNWQAAYKNRPPTEAIVFILGGSTYEESKVGGNAAASALA